MSKRYSPIVENANSAPETSFRVSGNIFPLNVAINRVSRALWPRKTDLELSARTSASDRVVRNWIALRCGISAEGIVGLLRSEEGLLYLEALMVGAKPKWWRRFQRSARLAALRAAQEQQRREIEQLELDFAE